MGQKEVVDLLKKMFNDLRSEYPTGFIGLSAAEICKNLEDKANSKSISNSIKKLQEFGEIESIQIDVNLAKKIYGNSIKKPMKIFFVVES